MITSNFCFKIAYGRFTLRFGGVDVNNQVEVEWCTECQEDDAEARESNPHHLSGNEF